MCMIPHYNTGGERQQQKRGDYNMHNPHIIIQEGGRQQQERGNYNVYGKMHYNGRYNSGQHTHYNTEGNN